MYTALVDKETVSTFDQVYHTDTDVEGGGTAGKTPLFTLDNDRDDEESVGQCSEERESLVQHREYHVRKCLVCVVVDC